MEMPRKIIVAEISKSWPESEFTRDHGKSIGNIFEDVIFVNRQRGYVLKEWQLNSIFHSPDHFVETIIAIFELMSHLAAASKTAEPAKEVRCIVDS